MIRNKDLEALLLNLLQTHKLKEQIDIQNILKKYGHDVPQATLSRYLKKLKIAKVAGVYKVIECAKPLHASVIGIKVSDFGLIVLHTNPGDANSIAYYLDQKYVHATQTDNSATILGTIAGDDTILLILKNKDDLQPVLKMLYAEYPHLKN